MKNFFKKLAFVLALAMVVTAIAPAAQASAAAQPTLNATSKKIYIDGDYTGKYSDTFTLKVWNKGDYRVTFASSDTKIATVTKWYGVVTAKAVGTATITATVSNKTTRKVVKTLSSKVYVKKNADSVAFGSLAKFDQPLVVGDKVKINVARKAGTVTAWKQADKTQITDYTLWTSSNPEVATVDKWGTVKAIAAGETTISAVAMQTEGKVATTAPATVKVTVVGKGITSAVQTKSNQILVTFGAAQDTDAVTSKLNVTPADASKIKPVVKEVKWNDAKTEATVIFYLDLEDKVVYTVTVTDTDFTKEFVASVGDVASVTITKPTIAIENVAATLKYALKDANGIELPLDNDKIEYAVVDGEVNGYIGSDNDGNPAVVIFEKGKSLTVQATYHTGKYTDEGEEIVVKSAAYPVKAVSAEDATLNKTLFTVSTKSHSSINWDSFTQNLRVTLEAKDASRILAKVTDNAGNTYETNEIVSDKFEFTSLDTTKVEVDNDGVLYPIKEGTAQVKVTVKENKKSFLVQVTVAPKSKISSVVYDKTNFIISDKGYAVDDVPTIKVTVKDQYNTEIDYSLTSENIVTSINKTEDATPYLDLSEDNKIIFNTATSSAPEGRYDFKVTIGDFSRVISINVKESGTGIKKVVSTSDSVYDLALNNDNSSEKLVNVTYFNYDKNNVKVSKESTSNYDIIVTDPSGKKIDSDLVVDNADTYSIKVVTASGSAASGSALSKELEKTGNYQITITEKGNANKILSRVTLTIKDTQVVPTVKKLGEVVTAGDALSGIQKGFKVSTSNKSSKVEITSANYENVGSTDRYVVKKIFVKETFKNGNYFIHEINVNANLTIK